ncbi:MAG: polysaccharide biosynthesis protein, partial [Oxalobacteraceae bacterium]
MRAVLELSRIKKQLLAASIDSVALPLIFFLAIWLRYDTVDMALMGRYWWLMLAIPIVSLPIFVRTGLYRAMIRFIDQKIVYVVVLGVTVSLVVLVTAAAIATRLEGLSRGV